MTNIGQPRPEIFNPDKFLDCVEMLINSDEVERALLMLDNMPAFYRDHPPARALAIRERLHKQLWTPVQYKGIYDGLEFDPTYGQQLLRCNLLLKEIAKFNDSGIEPNIMELAPGAKFVEGACRNQSLRATFEYLSLDERKHLDAEFSFNIFIAFELIEHLSDPWEIFRNYLKFNRVADIVMISTPLYTYGGGMPNWQDRELGHLRTYTPTELHKIAAEMFQGYSWECFTDDTIVLVGRKA